MNRKLIRPDLTEIKEQLQAPPKLFRQRKLESNPAARIRHCFPQADRLRPPNENVAAASESKGNQHHYQPCTTIRQVSHAKIQRRRREYYNCGQ